MLREAWERYRLPLAITEAHIACTREEQLRWFMEIWRGAVKLRGEGADVRAVTAWSLLGAFDWNSLLTRSDGHYESGAYDLRAGGLRPTAIASMIETLAHGREFRHPTLEAPGWWRRNVRFIAPPVNAPGDRAADREEDECPPCVLVLEDFSPASTDRLVGRPILITGGSGRLARGFVRAAQLRGLPHRVCSRAELDITNADAVERALRTSGAWAVINCAGYSRIDDAEASEQECIRANVHGAATLAAVCARTQTPLVTFSSDHVFDGGKRRPYVESDKPCALSVYGESKLLGERQALAAFPETLVIRAGTVFAPSEHYDFLRDNLRAMAQGERVRIENDIRMSGTYLPDLVHATLDLLIDGEAGVWHLANTGAVTPEQFLIAAADIIHLDRELIDGAPIWKLNRPALRPRNRVLESERGQLLPRLEDALSRYCREVVIEERAGELLAAS